MANSTVDITGPFDSPQKLLRIIDNGDGTYSVAASVLSTPGTNVVCVLNCTTTPLLANATFTGSWMELLDYTNISIAVGSNVASATNGLVVQWSIDGVTVDDTDTFTIAAGGHKQFTFGVAHRYFRVVYTNGGTNQTTFRMQVLLHKTAPKPSSHRIQDTIADEDDAELVEAILKLRTAQNNYVSGAATNSGNFKVSLEEVVSSVVLNTVPSDNLTISEFGEQRVAAPGNRADVEFLYDKQPLLMDDISTGGGTAVHQANGRDILLSIVNTTTNTVAGMRQHYWAPYTPGSGQEIDITGTMDAANIGGGTMYAFLRSTVTGSTTLETVAQSSWLAATTGVNWNFSQIFRISFQSLKVGRIQFSLVRGGIPTKVCEITNDNERVTGYWQYAALPPYWKIYNDADNTIVEFGYGDELNGVGFRYVFNGKNANVTSRAVCTTVKSQGGAPLFEMAGLPFVTPVNAAVTVSTTLIPILSLQVAATFNSLVNRAVSIPTGYSMQTDNPIEYAIFYRPTLTGPSWVPINTTYHGINYDITASAISGGVMIDHDYLSSGVNQVARIQGVLGKIIMSLGSGTADILSLAAVRTGSNNASVRSALKGIEIR